ncbi:multicystatin isoform X3 [Arachis duranensis]|uniref:Multicystatin isoform X3 n=1 Tax=Arachis duranensis TaxID=130453 RepID=A0A6P5MLZ9_ARADU|nr:multicystatin isoform X3 [Arachis duranensis]XP_020986044.1 multicystatin isoform X3 [Arachis duranensis]
MASAGEKRGRDDVDDKLNNTVGVTSSDEDDDAIAIQNQLLCVSLGFDVPEFGYALAGGIRPMKLGGRYDELVCNFAKQALQVYNNQNNANFEFDNLVKANIQAVSGFMYYITFTARSGDNAPQTFCTKVWQKVMNKGTEVKFCVMATVKQEAGTYMEESKSLF